MKITMIIGEPCVGKSLLVKELMTLGKPWEFHQPKYVPHHHSESMGLTILGRYDEPHKFPGTDRMSMAAQPQMIQWLIRERNAGRKAVLFEGDRLGNYSMAKALQYITDDLAVVALYVPQEFLAKRRAVERADQNAKFVLSRMTKIRNLKAAIARRGIPMFIREHTNLSHTHDIIAWIRKHRL